MKLLVSRSSDLMCRTVKGLGPAAGRAAAIRGPLATHASSCLRCQADLARYRRLRRELSGLAQRIESSPVPMAPRVERAIWAQPALITRPRRAARLAVAIAAATAAAAGTAVFSLWRRTRAAV
jgi:anti-sigma factor RsiW